MILLIMILSKQKCSDRRPQLGISLYLATIAGSFVHLFWYSSARRGSLMNEMKEADSMTGHCTDKECYHWLGHKYFDLAWLQPQAIISKKV